MKEQTYENASIYLIELNKISPNPFQPRREFSTEKLTALANSIRQYGVLQPIVVTRKEYSDGSNLKTRYELIAGERRFRASKIAGLEKIPAIIREGDHTDKEKFELAIIENIQREDLNPVDKARAFQDLVENFNLTHAQVAEKMSKSREFVSNALRILKLPEYILEGVSMGDISEGHTRPLLMLDSRPEDQRKLFEKIKKEQITVREAERYARNIAVEKVRKKPKEKRPEILALEKKLERSLGTRVHIDTNNGKGNSGKVTIEYFSKEDLDKILEVVSAKKALKEEGLAAESTLADSYKSGSFVDAKKDNFEKEDKAKEETNFDVDTTENDIDDDFDISGGDIFDIDDSEDDMYSALSDDDIETDLETKIEPKAQEEKEVIRQEPKEEKVIISRKDNSDNHVKKEEGYKKIEDNKEDVVVSKRNDTDHKEKTSDNIPQNNDFSAKFAQLLKDRKELEDREKKLSQKENYQKSQREDNNNIIKINNANSQDDNNYSVSKNDNDNSQIKKKEETNNNFQNKRKQEAEENANNQKNSFADALKNLSVNNDNDSLKKDDTKDTLSQSDSNPRVDTSNRSQIKEIKQGKDDDDDDDFFKKLLARRREERKKKEREERDNPSNNSQKRDIDFDSFRKKSSDNNQDDLSKNDSQKKDEKPAWATWEDDSEEIKAESGNPILAALLRKAQNKRD